MPHLFDFAQEIRDMIWEECLVLGEVFPYNITDDTRVLRYGDFWPISGNPNALRPEVNILLVSRRVYNEALRFLYSKNCFVLPACGLSTRFFDRLMPVAKSMITSIYINFSMDDMTPLHRAMLLEKNSHAVPWQLLIGIVDDEVRETIHCIAHQYLVETIWRKKINPVLELPNLKRLLVRVDDAFCTDEVTCKIQKKLPHVFDAGFAHYVPKIWVRGYDNQPREAFFDFHERIYWSTMTRWARVDNAEDDSKVQAMWQKIYKRKTDAQVAATIRRGLADAQRMIDQSPLALALGSAGGA